MNGCQVRQKLLLTELNGLDPEAYLRLVRIRGPAR
jgi:hypothetical protein